MSFTITGPGFYRQRDGDKHEWRPIPVEVQE